MSYAYQTCSQLCLYTGFKTEQCLAQSHVHTWCEQHIYVTSHCIFDSIIVCETLSMNDRYWSHNACNLKYEHAYIYNYYIYLFSVWLTTIARFFNYSIVSFLGNIRKHMLKNSKPNGERRLGQAGFTREVQEKQYRTLISGKDNSFHIFVGLGNERCKAITSLNILSLNHIKKTKADHFPIISSSLFIS